VDEKSNRQIAEGAFREWQDGTGYITDLLADDLTWTIVGRSRASKTYESKERFVGEVRSARAWWWRLPPSTTASPSTSCGTRSPRRASRTAELPRTLLLRGSMNKGRGP
jgi:hypothetical protein